MGLTQATGYDGEHFQRVVGAAEKLGIKVSNPSLVYEALADVIEALVVRTVAMEAYIMRMRPGYGFIDLRETALDMMHRNQRGAMPMNEWRDVWWYAGSPAVRVTPGALDDVPPPGPSANIRLTEEAKNDDRDD